MFWKDEFDAARLGEGRDAGDAQQQQQRSEVRATDHFSFRLPIV